MREQNQCIGLLGHSGFFGVGVPNEHNFWRGAREVRVEVELLLGH